MNQITIDSVTFKAAFGESKTLTLNACFSVPGGLSAQTVFRLALPRLPISASACLLLGLLADETFAGLPRQHSYTELGAALGRGKHTAVRAVLELRKAGLLTASRVGLRSDQLLFSCDPLLYWAESVTSAPAVAAAPVAPQPVAVSVPSSLADDELYGKPDSFSSDDHPDWPSVPADWRRLHKVPAPHNAPWPAEYCIPFGVKPWLGPVTRLPDGTFDREQLLRKPFELLSDAEQEAYLSIVREREDAERHTGLQEAVDDPPVDASEEREAELKLAGPQADDGEDEFRFDSGADTAETDIGRGVKANPDL